jgi:hypothetical protein
MPRRSESRQQQIRQWVAEQEASGLTVARFARERGVSAWTLYDWKRRSQRAGDRADGARGRFVQVNLAPVPPAAPSLSVELASGVRVHVPAGFDASELQRLIGALASC